MPFCHLRLEGRIPPDPAYPTELRTIGDRLRRRRLELRLTQEELAAWLKATESTIWNWESGWSTPTPLFRSAIRMFLGEASPDDPLDEQCRQLRWGLGFTQKDLARRLGVSRSTIEDWETGRRRPRADHRKVLQRLFRAPV